MGFPSTITDTKLTYKYKYSSILINYLANFMKSDFGRVLIIGQSLSAMIEGIFLPPGFSWRVNLGFISFEPEFLP